jgi:hypothetical protein
MLSIIAPLPATKTTIKGDFWALKLEIMIDPEGGDES